jgi:hypothetical protein
VYKRSEDRASEKWLRSLIRFSIKINE